MYNDASNHAVELCCFHRWRERERERDYDFWEFRFMFFVFKFWPRNTLFSDLIFSFLVFFLKTSHASCLDLVQLLKKNDCDTCATVP